MESDNLTGLFADRYTIERTLGRGASATVYLANDSKQDREIALKVLDPELANAIGSKRFMQEIHITSRLQHPHILPIHDSGQWNGLLYYTLPFVAGESLRSRLEREKQLPIDECVQLTCNVASALGHAHSKGVIHRDVKPENILLSDGHALVADFGIARATENRTAERLTSSGLIVGTSQYMSPEQASGEREIDARSDIYSLGCVLYEMLAGVEPFVGPNVQAIIAQRFTHSPRPVSMFRPTVPQHLESALRKALEISAADRFQTMKEFAAALPSTSTPSGDRRRPGRALRDAFRTTTGKVGFAAATVFAAALAVAAVNTSSLRILLKPAVQLDSSLYLVLPIADANGKVSERAQQAADAVMERMVAFNVPLASEAKLAEAIEDFGNPGGTPGALKVATAVGAGNLIWLRPDASLNGMTLKLVDVRTGKDISTTSSTALDSALVYRMLREPTWPAAAIGGDGLTKSYSAWHAYGRGHAALKQWNLERAEAEFALAERNDPAFVPPRLWSAQLTAWKHAPELKDKWVHDATMAAAAAKQLSPRDATVALALHAIAEEDFPAACAHYRSLTQRDSMDFAGWYGLGECQMQDKRVVPSRSSSSGFVFRTSYANAAADYFRAISIDPGVYLITSLDIMTHLLPVSASTGRRGQDAGGNHYAAWPSVINDTIGFVPYPLSEFSRLTRNAANNAALERNNEKLFEFANSWARVDSLNADAFEALAFMLEVRGDVAGRAGAGVTASEALQKATKLSTNDRQRIRIIGSEIRMRIKRYEFAAADRLADSLLTKAQMNRGEPDLMSSAAMSGRIQRFAREAEASHIWLPIGYAAIGAPSALLATSADLFARASLGDCTSALKQSESQLRSQMESYLTPDKREPALHILASRSLSLATPCTNGVSATRIAKPENALTRAQLQFGKGNATAARLILDSLQRNRANMRPGDLSLDHTYQEAWLRAAVGDSAGAARQLDLALDALPVLSASALRQPAASAALGRSMILRANLAAKAGDRTKASRWAASVLALWKHADKELQMQLAPLKSLAPQ
ncbi:MAG: protein kinase [Gemmatimonadaceae bacterium]|nr:protein kinase [Gemmatimonadaceae bacterium]